MLAVFASPSRYVQGRNATAELGATMQHQQLEGPALIVAGDRVQALLADTWRASLTAADMDYSVHRFGGECSQEEIDAGVDAARAAGAKVIIGAGGGKCLDTARAVASKLSLPVVNCPTLASSDAPCSALSVIYAPDGTVDRYQFYPANPSLVLVDTSVIAKAPRRLLVAGLGDAMATWYEARTVIEAHSVNQLGGRTTLTGAALAQLCANTLYADAEAALAAVDVGAVTPALDRVVEANTLLSGLGFESGGLAIAHSVHNGLTTLPETHSCFHGEKVAFGLLVQLVVEGRPADEFDKVRRFCRTVGLPTTLADLGVADLSDKQLRQVAERTVAPGETAHHEPFEVTAEMIADGVRTADAWARHAKDATG